MLSDALELIEKKQVMVSMDKEASEKQTIRYLNHLKDALVAYHAEGPKLDPLSGVIPASSNAANLLPRINLKIEGFVGDEKKLGEEVGKVIREALKEPEFKVGQWVVFRDDYASSSGQPQLLKLIHISDSFLSSYGRTTVFEKQLCRPATPEEMFKVGAQVECHCQNGTIIRGKVRRFGQLTGGGFEILFEDLSPRDADYNRFILIEPAPKEKP